MYEGYRYRVDTINCGTSVKEGCFYFRMEEDDGPCQAAVVAVPTEVDSPAVVNTIVPVLVIVVALLALIGAALVAAALLRRRKRRYTTYMVMHYIAL